MPSEGPPPQHNDHPQTPAKLAGLSTYVYEPLQSPQHVRLLRMPKPSSTLGEHASGSKSKSHDLEHYEIIQVPLEAYENGFEAISYAWGDPTRGYWIKVVGEYSLPITETLAVALPQLAHISPGGLLWIDQVCIDQRNEHERGQQVLIMGEIYRSASRVLIWTGGELDGLSGLKAQLSGPHDFYKSHNETLVQLLSRPWFNRGWTIQEAVLAKMSILIAGSCVLPLEDLKRAWRKGIVRSEEQCDRSKIGESSFHIIMALRKGVVARWHDPGFDGLLNSLGDTQMSDARDHVYAFLGLKNDPRIIIRPDYNASISETFTNATRAIIEGTGRLDCLRYVPLPHEPRGFTLPSWVPNWSMRNTESRILHDSSMHGSHPQFRAAKGFSHHIRLARSSQADVLEVSGRIIDFVELRIPNPRSQVYSTVYPNPWDAVKNQPLFFSLTDDQVSRIDDAALTDPTQTLRKRLLTVIVAGHVDPEVALAMYDKNRANYEEREKNGALSYQIRRLWHHQLWLTRSRKLALIPPTSCERGDPLAIVHGLNAPLLLSKRPDGTFAVRGQCYLEDAMFGEAVTWKEEEADILSLS